MIRRSALLALLAILVLIVAAGCGESDSDGDATEAPRNTATPAVAPAGTDAPTEGAPTEGAPTEDAEAEDAPTEGAPTEDAPTEEEELGGEAEAPPTKGFDDLQQWETPPPLTLENNVDYQAKITTNFGEVTVDLFEEEAPQTVNNFVFLANEGFYENVPVHRILSGFVIQSGDPTGTGRGGPGYRFNDEPVVRPYTKGILAMANAGPNTNGSQFFIVLDDLSGRLPPSYTIFGEVVEGIEVVDQIAAVQVTASESGEPSKPTEPVFISNIEIVRD